MIQGEPRPHDYQALRDLCDPSGKVVEDDWDEDVVPESYEIEHFEVNHVRKSTNVVELKKMLAVLRSGKEGVYEEFQKLVEDRIRTLGGKLKFRPEDHRAGYKDKLDAANELDDWLQGFTAESKKWKASTAQSTLNASGASVRAPSISQPTEASLLDPSSNQDGTIIHTQNKHNVENSRIASTDYRAWEQLDVDAAIDSSVVGKDTTRTGDAMSVASGIPTAIKLPCSAHQIPVKDPALEESGRRREYEQSSASPMLVALAEAENTKGNEALRSHDDAEGIVYYTRALSLYQDARIMPPPKYLANRALAHLKRQLYDRAVADATSAIHLGPPPELRYKCYLRLGMAQIKRGQYEPGLEAYEECSRIASLQSGNAPSQHAPIDEHGDADAQDAQKPAIINRWTEHEPLAQTAKTKWRQVDFPAYRAWAERGSKAARQVPIQVVEDSDDEE